MRLSLRRFGAVGAGSVLLATGATTGATSQAQTFTNGILAPSIQAISNSTTHGWKNAAGTNVLTIDTTNGRVGVGVTPTAGLHVSNAGTETWSRMSITGTTSNIVGIGMSPTVAAASTCYGVLSEPIFSPSGNITTANAYLIVNNLNSASANVTNQRGVYIALRSNAGYTGTLSNGHAVYIDTPAYSGSAPATLYGIYVAAQTGGTSTNYAIYTNGGLVRLGDRLIAAASTTSAASVTLTQGSAPTTPAAGDIWNDGALSFYNADSTTNAVVNHLRLRRGSTGTAAAGFGLGIIAELESSTTDAQSAGRLSFEWVTATHASRASRGKLTAFYTTTEQAAMTWDGDTGGLRLGFYDVTPVARQVLATGAGATVDNVITALQNLGLVKQS